MGKYFCREDVILRVSAISGRQNVYTLRYNLILPEGIEFDWNDGNTRHLAAHDVTPAKFEQVLNGDPLYMDYESISNEERYRAAGLTNGGRLLSVVFTVRNGRVRAVTAFPASASDKRAFLE